MDLSNKTYGHCRCCLKEGVYTDGKNWKMLKCFNVEISTDPRISLLVCSPCGKFLKKANKFRNMVAASQKKLLNALPHNDKTIDQKTLTLEIEYVPKTCEVKVERLEPELSGTVPLSNTSECEQATTYVDVLKKYLSSDVTIGFHKAVKQEHIEEEPDYSPHTVPMELNEYDLQMSHDGCIKEEGGFSDVSETDVEIVDQVNTKTLTPNELKIKEKSMEDEMNSQIRQNLSTILQYSTVIPFTIAKGDRFECIYCDTIYTRFKELRSHVQTNHNEEFLFKLQVLKMRALKDDSETILRVDISCLQCRLCDKRLTTIDNLVQHLINGHNIEYHNITRDPPHNVLCFDLSLDALKCLDCEKVFVHFKGLLMHMNQHYGSYLCHDCGNKYLYAHTYKLHVKMNHSNRRDLLQYQCSICQISFANNSNLKRHVLAKHRECSAIMLQRGKRMLDVKL